VRAQLKSLGQLADGCRPIHHAGRGQEKLVLLRLEARVARRLLGKAQEAPDAVAELGERLEIGIGRIRS
jgi:hypothetical protein